MKKYGRDWRSLSGNPVQVWIIDGAPRKEKELLKMLKDIGINGWTVLFKDWCWIKRIPDGTDFHTKRVRSAVTSSGE